MKVKIQNVHSIRKGITISQEYNNTKKRKYKYRDYKW